MRRKYILTSKEKQKKRLDELEKAECEDWAADKARREYKASPEYQRKANLFKDKRRR